jgi:SAM-dependent methyltransferase
VVNIFEFNRRAWDQLVESGNRWTVPVSSDDIKRAREGDWQVLLTPSLPVPHTWFPDLRGCRLLCLASGGGQQGPILAAAGAEVTVFDASAKQLEQDQFVAHREGLSLETIQGDMADLACFDDEAFDFIFHPCSNCFAEAIRPIWQEAYRVLRPGGSIVSGFVQPFHGLFDPALDKQGIFQLKFSMPHSDLKVSEADRAQWFGDHAPIEFVHSLDDQLGGQLDAGFLIAGLYEDDWGGSEPIDRLIKSFVAVRSIKPVG